MINHSGAVWRQHSIRAFLVFVIALCFDRIATRADSVERGYKPLFDGQTLKGWTYLGKPGGEYFVSNGVIVCPANSMGNLVTDQEYGDFSLRLEYKFESNGNNGVAIRAPMSTENLTYVGVEIQMLDDTAPKHRNLHAWQYNGSVYGIVAATNGTANIGEWNTEEIECLGRNYRITLNGREIVHANLNDVTNLETMQDHPGMFRLRGHLGFLGHDSHFEFRNIRIKELDKPEKDNVPPEGFRALFNGRKLTGLRQLPPESPIHRDPEKLEIKSGAIRPQRDTLSSVSEYKNFELSVDWKIEPGACGSISFRDWISVQLGSSNTTHQFTTPENSGQMGKKAPLISAENPAGEWNRLRIVALGERSHVFLNGQLVQNDLSIPDSFSPKTGPDAGRILIQPFGWFKNIYIREIK